MSESPNKSGSEKEDVSPTTAGGAPTDSAGPSPNLNASDAEASLSPGPKVAMSSGEESGGGGAKGDSSAGLGVEGSGSGGEGGLASSGGEKSSSGGDGGAGEGEGEQQRREDTPPGLRFAEKHESMSFEVGGEGSGGDTSGGMSQSIGCGSSAIIESADLPQARTTRRSTYSFFCWRLRLETFTRRGMRTCGAKEWTAELVKVELEEDCECSGCEFVSGIARRRTRCIP